VFVFPWARVLQLAVALVLALLGIAAMRAAPRKPPNQFFALFAFLVAGNFIADALVFGFVGLDGLAGARLARRIAYQFVLLDPPVALYFALLYPRRSPLLDRPWVKLGIFLPALVLTVAHVVAPVTFLPASYDPPGTDPVVVSAHALAGIVAQLPAEVHLGIYYALALFILLRNWVAEAPGPVRDQLGLLVIGFGVALMPREGLVAAQFSAFVADVAIRPIVAMLERTLPTLAMFFLLRAYALRRSAGREDEVRLMFRRMGAFIAAIFAAWLANTVSTMGVSFPFESDPTSQFVYALRWVFFGSVVALALLRYQVFDLQVKVRRVARAGAVAGALAMLALVAVLASGAAAAALRPEAVLAIAVVVAGAPLAARWASGAADRRFPGAGGSVDGTARRIEMYRAALEAALVEGKLPPAQEQELAELRRTLGLT
jgi:hypothetical protein